MKRYIKSTQYIFAGYSCNGWFNILKTQKIPISHYDDLDVDERAKIDKFDDDEWGWDTESWGSPDYIEEGYESVRRYTDGWDRRMNSYLRGLPFDNSRGFSNFTPSERADKMSKLISRESLPKDIVTVRWADIDNLIVYLGESAPEDIKNGNVEKYIGKIITEKGFYSSSMAGHLNHPYYEHKDVQFINLIPKGSSGIYVWNHTSRKKNEYEIILLNGASFIIRDIQYSESGFDASSGLQSNSKYRIFMEKI